MTYGIGFKPTGKDVKAMIAPRRENRRAKTIGQTTETPLRIPHLFETFPAPQYTYQPQSSEHTSTSERPGSVPLNTSHKRNTPPSTTSL